jgi:uncharacterized protein (TIGR02246 family)
MTKGFIWTGVALLALSAVACQPQAGPLSEEDVAAIQNHVAAHADTEGASDWAATAALYTEDALRMQPNEPAIQGRAAIQAAFESWPGTITSLSVRAAEVDGRGDLAYARGPYSIIFTVEGVEEAMSDDGKFVAIFLKQEDGSWLTSRLIYNSDLPLPAPPAAVAEAEE